MFLIFDTETTGLPRDWNAPLTDADNWPRCTQIAWQLHDKTAIAFPTRIIWCVPDGFTIPYDAEKIHGISTALAKKRDPIAEVLKVFSRHCINVNSSGAQRKI